MSYLVNMCVVLDLFAIMSTIFAVVFYDRYREKMKKVSNYGNEKIFILLPAFKEQSLVNETLDYYSKLKGYNYMIIVITSEQEEYENKRFGTRIKTTRECVEEYLDKKNDCSIVHLHGSYTSGTKSTQLNFALNAIIQSMRLEDYSSNYIGVYDFDARPNLEILKDLRKIIYYKNNPEVIQQVPINLKNYQELAMKKNCAMIVHCYQTMIRSVGIELATLLLHLKGIFLPLYCMGAGMFFRLDTLIENGFFPEPVDDIALGYRLYLQGKRFGLFPKYSFVESPNSIEEVTKQDVGIFKGICYGVLEIKQKSKLRRKIPTCCLIVHNILLRTVLPWIYLIYILLSLYYTRLNLAVVMILVMPLARTIVGSYSMKRADAVGSKMKKNLNLIKLFIYSYLWRFIRTFGPLKVVFSKIIS